MARLEQQAFEKVLGLLRQQTVVDFGFYKSPTLLRRMDRRMAAHKIKSLNHYHDYLRTHPSEIKALFNDLLIQVSGFFRDPAAFEILKREHLAPLMRAKVANGPVRVWVSACSSGEEVYSIAIILAELTTGKKNSRAVQIFGTDINDEALNKARAGFYPDTIKRQMSPERLQRFFETAHGGYRIRKSIREMCIFARQNITMDPPFSNLDLVSCRNVLIYLNPETQRKVMPVFHYALQPTGVLMLGASETIGRFSELFSLKDSKAKIYSRKPTTKVSRHLGKFLTPTSTATQSPASAKLKLHSERGHGKNKLSREELRAVVAKAVKQNIGPQHEARVVPINMPLTQEKFYLVFADPKTADDGANNGNGKSSGKKMESAKIRRLREELVTARESLQTIIEQEEAANEELRAANEEVISSNEELQSSNEELETAKEELQSTNEELATVNNELESRNDELERSNALNHRLAAIVESSEDAIISKDLNGTILTWNNGAEKIFGYTADEIVGKSVTTLIPSEHHQDELSILARLRRGGTIGHYETVRKHKDGRLLDIWLTISPLRSSTGEIIGASKIARDITAKKRAESDLKHARDKAEQASRAKDDFLAALSHELRTPLSPVLLVAGDSANNTDLPPGIRANFDMIRRNVELEARLIDDLLDLTRVTTGKLKLEKYSVNVHTILKNTIAMLQADIIKKEIVLEQKFDAFQNIISGDAIRLQQVFWNVLKNAIKFTPQKGRITIETRSKRNEYAIVVSDNGVGMTVKELDEAFNAFKQRDHADYSHTFGGLGLGLTICKKLVELHGGTIEAASDGRDCGSTFIIKFPLADWMETPTPKNASSEASSTDLQPPSNLHILLVEDHEPTRNVLASILVRHRHRVKMAVSVAEALALAAQNDFDLMISDIGLPDGTGYDLFRRLRKQSRIRGIALTGFGMTEDIKLSKEAGFDTHLTKPVKVQSLETALAKMNGMV